MKFTKMHGTGNDYVYINCFKESVPHPEALAAVVSDRHKGIGSDGLVLIMPSKAADFRMRMFNPDGSEAQMCGNAARCVGKYVYDNKLTANTEIDLETKAGIKHLRLLPGNKGDIEKVCVDMGEPVWEASCIPVAGNSPTLIDRPVDFGTELYRITCVSMGNPHVVVFLNTDDELTQLPLEATGRKIEHHPMFPERTNVEFVHVISPTEARMRVWERGTGETQACGTGACAVLAAAVANGLMDRKAVIVLPGGELEIEWRADDNRILMTGEAVIVFEGEWAEG